MCEPAVYHGRVDIERDRTVNDEAIGALLIRHLIRALVGTVLIGGVVTPEDPDHGHVLHRQLVNHLIRLRGFRQDGILGLGKAGGRLPAKVCESQQNNRYLFHIHNFIGLWV